MDNTATDSDISMSPSQILERLQLLRELQLMQRGKLEKQQLQYEDSPTTSGSITEIVSRFTNSTSYNTFRSLLQGSYDGTNSPQLRPPDNELCRKISHEDLIEGVSVLHVSHEAGIVITSPTSNKRVSPLKFTSSPSPIRVKDTIARDSAARKQIELDEMPILSPKQNKLVEEKFQNEGKPPAKNPSPKDKVFLQREKKPFLKRGQGMSRFGIEKKDLIIQNTQSLPWKKKGVNKIQKQINPKPNRPQKTRKNIDIEMVVPDVCLTKNKNKLKVNDADLPIEQENKVTEHVFTKPQSNVPIQVSQQMYPPARVPVSKPKLTKPKNPLSANRGSTWASILTKEQNDFLSQLKQSDYYKNFTSPTKSVASDMSCDENVYKERQQKEKAEQNMFELLENKISNESFSLENSFFNRFLRHNPMEYSGESTPQIMQRCLAENPKLLRIPTGTTQQEITCDSSHCDTCDCCTDCDHETCSSVSTSCSCQTVEETPKRIQQKNTGHQQTKENKKTTKEVEKQSDTKPDKSENDTMKENMAEMNAKLIATSELLKERLQELEDEIETFRKENINLTKSREELDSERQRFYEEKSNFEQKLNEEKILSEYYLAEEKDKLSKQKLMYDRYVREIRGRLNKKEKDEVTNLKKEIEGLKDDIRVKDIKSTSTIARLRNQIKILEKDKKELNDEVEKLKKENRRLSHSNDITRRMTNIKYLEQINKKLRNGQTKDAQSEVHIDRDAKYKSFEIERQSRNRQRAATTQTTIRPRAKSVPNLNVTSRYAKYFSQKDSISHMDGQNYDDSSSVDEHLNYDDDNLDHGDIGSLHDERVNDDVEENHLEKLYLSRFKNDSPEINNTNTLSKNYKSISNEYKIDQVNESGDFFLQKNSTLKNRSTSPQYRTTSPNFTSSSSRTKSPISVINQHMYTETKNLDKIHENRPKSPVSILSNRNSYSDKMSTINQVTTQTQRSPEFNKTNLSKTSLNPVEINKTDGSKEYIFPNGNVKYISADGKYCKFMYYNGDVKENFFDEGRVKYFYAETKTYHTTHADGHEVVEFSDGQTEKRYKDGSSEIHLPNGSIRYHDPKNTHVREEWRFPDGTTLTVSAAGEQRVVFSNGQVEVHAKDHKRREFPDGTVKLIYNDGTSETRYSSGRVRIKDKHGNLIMDSAPG